MLKGPAKFLALLALALGAVFAVPAIATATPVPDCRTVTVHLADRPDNGNHGVWATDQIDRTVKVCHIVPAKEQSESVAAPWHYGATLVDDGHFVTVTGGGNSPNAGHPVGHVVPGYLGGQFTATFTAPASWGGWLGAAWNGKTLTGAPGGPGNPSTSTWIKALWTEGFNGNSINDDWTWTYWTCSKSLEGGLERWTDDHVTNGHGPKDGDITGKPCPSPSPSPSVTATHGATTPAGSTTPGALPVTGAKTDWLIGGGAAVLVIGVIAVIVGRRRRNGVRFEA